MPGGITKVLLDARCVLTSAKLRWVALVPLFLCVVIAKPAYSQIQYTPPCRIEAISCELECWAAPASLTCAPLSNLCDSVCGGGRESAASRFSALYVGVEDVAPLILLVRGLILSALALDVLDRADFETDPPAELRPFFRLAIADWLGALSEQWIGESWYLSAFNFSDNAPTLEVFSPLLGAPLPPQFEGQELRRESVLISVYVTARDYDAIVGVLSTDFDPVLGRLIQGGSLLLGFRPTAENRD
jgi:hypothetical protein